MDKVDKIIRESVEQETIDSIHKVDTEDFIKLRAAATNFLQQINILSDMNKRTLTKSSLKDKMTYIYKMMREETSFTRQILQYQHQFEKELNEFLQRKIYLTYVNKDGTLNVYDDAGIGELYKTATANKGRGNISQSNIVDMEMVEEALQRQIRLSAAMRKEVYTTAIERYSNNDNEVYMNYKPSERTFYWWKTYHKVLGGWTDPIVNKGPIAEGYVGAVINEDPDVTNADIESALAALWNNHISKDSVGAAIKGDVVMDSHGNIQFAVKTGSFSTAKIGQYIRLAYNILQLKQLTQEELKQYLPKLINFSKISQSIIDNINNKVEDTVDNEIDKAIKT